MLCFDALFHVHSMTVYQNLMLCGLMDCVYAAFRGRNGMHFWVKMHSSLRGSSCGKPQVLAHYFPCILCCFFFFFVFFLVILYIWSN